MSAGARLKTRLTTHAGTAALVGTRVYPMKLPQNSTYPAIVYQRISGAERLGSTKLREARYQLSCWGATYASGQALAAQVRDALEGWGVGGAVPMSRIVNENDDYEPDDDVYRVILDAMLHLFE